MPKQIVLSKELAEKVEKAAKDQGLTVDEYVSKVIHERCGDVEVTFKMPGDLLRMLEEERFFCWERDAFFFNAVKSLVAIEINEMEIDECQRLSKKFGDEYIYIHMSEKK